VGPDRRALSVEGRGLRDSDYGYKYGQGLDRHVYLEQRGQVPHERRRPSLSLSLHLVAPRHKHGVVSLGDPRGLGQVLWSLCCSGSAPS